MKMMVLFFSAILFSARHFGQTEELHQPHPITTARLGDSVTLQCFHSLDLNKMTFYWYKQVLGGKPSPLAFSHPDGTSVKNKRASIQRTKESLHLTIKNINPSDEAVYFCGWNNDNNEIEFGNGSFLTLKSDSQHEPKTTAVIQIPVLHGDSVNLRCTVPYVNRSRAEETHPAVIYTHKNSRDQCEILSSTQSCVHNFFCRKIWFGNGTRLGGGQHEAKITAVIQTPLTRGVRSGDSVTLQCTVLQESSSQDFRVFWFRPTSGEFHPASIYTEITSGDHCEILSGTSSCIYEFTKDKLGLSDAGMYCCAVATCGKIIFGNGTKLELLVSAFQQVKLADVKVAHPSSQDTNADILNYAAVHISKKKRRERRKRDLPEDVVYSDVKYSTNVQ
ncbi:uncharacterized protein LOC114768559 [Denticeps clupeoides]|uniref:uncharacterized protein LOC114768559 n=1 Tax=Denticeps clupeoides TaxID=299321 RepID=UPI0010A33227|nr:uncharacterized protein LOC114768559 [Denticeps clupeoides]